VESLTSELTRDGLIIHITPRRPESDLGLECWGGSRKADVMAKLLGRRIEITTAVPAPS
jgi:hypothetical protein